MRVNDNVSRLRQDQILLKTKLDRIDSLVVSGSEQDSRLRADIGTSLEDLTAQLAQIQNQLQDLQQVVYRYSQAAGQSVQPVTISPPADSPPTEDTLAEPPPPSVDCRQLWDNAFKDMMRGQHDLAISGFSDYLKYCPGSDLADNSQYWIAEAYYEMKQYERAGEEFRKVLNDYPDSEKRSTAIFKIGRSLEELGNREGALEQFLILKNEYPGSVEYEQVKDKIDRWQNEPGN